MLLAIDTSTRTTGLAVLDGDEVLAELVWRTDLNHTRELLPNLERVLQIADVGSEQDRLAAIDRIAVAVGPGGYGGLRVGVSTAKALAVVRGIDLVGVDTLAAHAASAAAAPGHVWAALPAGRGELAVGRYRLDGAECTTAVAPTLLLPKQLAEALEPGDTVTGELAEDVVALLAARPGVRVLTGVLALRRAACVGWLGQARLDRNERDDPSTLQPVYLRRPAITESKKKRIPPVA